MHERMRKMIRQWMIGCFVLLVVGTPLFLVYQYHTRADRFLERAFEQLEDGGGSEKVELIRLSSGESFSVILEHSC